MVDQTVLSLIHQYIDVLENRGLPVAQVVLFGSQATGHVHEWSDIDLIIISEKFDVHSADDINLLWHATLEVDNRIEPIPCGRRQWQVDTATPILNIARREGIMINPQETPA